jgi:hypothetical protein
MAGGLGTELDDAQKVLGDVASWCWLDLAAKPPHMGVNVDGLVCQLHCPTTYNRQTKGKGFLVGTILFRRCSGRWRIFGGCEAPGIVIWWSVDRLGTCVTKSYMEKIVFTRACLSYVRAILAFIHVSLFDLLHQAAMGQIQLLSTCYQARMGSCGYAPLCLAPMATASRGLGLAMLIRCRKPLSVFDRWQNPACQRLL